MTDVTEVHPAERNVAAYAEAAELLARQIDLRGYGEIDFQPGDGTRYPFVILSRNRDIPVVTGTDRRTGMTNDRDYLVILASSFGNTYSWGGGRMHYDYCADKWARDCREWTGRVVATLLNALSLALGESE